MEESQAGVVVEVTNPDGGRLVVWLAPGSAVDPLALMQSSPEPHESQDPLGMLVYWRTFVVNAFQAARESM